MFPILSILHVCVEDWGSDCDPWGVKEIGPPPGLGGAVSWLSTTKCISFAKYALRAVKQKVLLDIKARVNCTISATLYQRVTAIFRLITQNANSLKLKPFTQQLIPSSFDHNREN